MYFSTIIKQLIGCSERYGNRIYLLVILLFLTGGLVYSLYLGNTLRFPDERLYLSIAKNIALGNGYSFDGLKPTAFLPPIYPLVLAVFFKAGLSIPAIRYLNFIYLALCLVVIRSILRHEKAENGTMIASVLLLAYGVLFYTAGTFYPQTLFTLCLLLIVRVAVSRFGFISALCFGALSALIILIHGTGVFVPPVVALWLFFNAGRKIDVIKKLSVSLLVALLCISLWTFRNYTAFHRFIPLTTHGGDTLYIGNNPHTTLSAWYNYVNDDCYKEASRLPEPDQNSYYIRRTIEFWTGHPLQAIKLYLEKLIEYFNFRNNLCVTKEFNTWRSILMFITYYPLLMCLVIRLLYIKKYPMASLEWMLLSLYIVSALFHALFLPRIRFRLPYDVLLIAFIGYMFALVARNYPQIGLACKQTGPAYGNDTNVVKNQISPED